MRSFPPKGFGNMKSIIYFPIPKLIVTDPLLDRTLNPKLWPILCFIGFVNTNLCKSIPKCLIFFPFTLYKEFEATSEFSCKRFFGSTSLSLLCYCWWVGIYSDFFGIFLPVFYPFSIFTSSKSYFIFFSLSLARACWSLYTFNIYLFISSLIYFLIFSSSHFTDLIVVDSSSNLLSLGWLLLISLAIWALFWWIIYYLTYRLSFYVMRIISWSEYAVGLAGYGCELYCLSFQSYLSIYSCFCLSCSRFSPILSISFFIFLQLGQGSFLSFLSCSILSTFILKFFYNVENWVWIFIFRTTSFSSTSTQKFPSLFKN